MKAKKFPNAIYMIIMAVSLTALMAGCATLSFKPADQQIRQRVEGMMNAKIENDWGKVYDYYGPAYKKTMPKDTFARMARAVYFTKFTITSIEVGPSGKEAVVKLTYDVVMKGFDFKDISETQKWINDGWNWYQDIDPSATPLGNAENMKK